ncbi:class I SAM-dependent methyltransferase [Streptomyces sp. ME02-8801-2C]|uniref:class I SAM-dependent methyltransferase n=1 Tax=Streptomyces sp. ME02-8801-2C TaxID=3028680 RepID=UPI0029A8B357|nr:class I SAM-dependent methyltransferase [Streptomyces sp. ME02-8801-2C]MDX3457478.1 class I SAM-dependent methyltransferase [Streptomyces sp. ME02-8801-2C]
MPAQHDIAAETELWDTFAASAFKGDAEPSFCWTQYAGHGPGPELLGNPRSVLEIGCGTGRALAYLAQRGVAARGVGLSPAMVKKTMKKWAGTGAEFVCAEVLEYLSEHEDAYDAVYSIFGAAWFTDPGRLFPLVRQRLRPGGVFVFSQPPAIPAAYGLQGMYKGGFAGKAMFTGSSEDAPAFRSGRSRTPAEQGRERGVAFRVIGCLTRRRRARPPGGRRSRS